MACWVRLGLTPSLGCNWYHAAFTRAGEPIVLVSKHLLLIKAGG